MPVLFVSHGAPTLALDDIAGADFARLAGELPRPRSVLVISAHWEATPARIGTTRTGHIVHDFAGFPRELYAVRYDAPGAPALASRVGELLGVPHDDARPWDHGVWVPLLRLWPDAGIPVLQLALPSRSTPPDLFELGRRLAPLREEGVLVLASGGMVHDFGSIDWIGDSPPPSFALEFERWVRRTLLARDWPRLLRFATDTPHHRRAHPTDEHFLPLLIAAGAASTTDPTVTFPIEGFELGSLSRLAVRFD
ncbi:MAG: dioxygenase [Planctomycetes bacterium]|nr:dioxygenase [Planctomycetota bacterium]